MCEFIHHRPQDRFLKSAFLYHEESSRCVSVLSYRRFADIMMVERVALQLGPRVFPKTQMGKQGVVIVYHEHSLSRTRDGCADPRGPGHGGARALPPFVPAGFRVCVHVVMQLRGCGCVPWARLAVLLSFFFLGEEARGGEGRGLRAPRAAPAAMKPLWDAITPTSRRSTSYRPTPPREQRTYVWDVSSTEWARYPAGKCLESPRFSCAGVDGLGLMFYPQGDPGAGAKSGQFSMYARRLEDDGRPPFVLMNTLLDHQPGRVFRVSVLAVL